MNYFKSYTFIFFLITLLGTIGCQDKWDEHNEGNDPNLKENLFFKISKDPELTRFSELLVKTGFDKVLSSNDKSYTVWAPSNEAIAAVDPAILADTAKVKLLIANHIALASVTTTASSPSRQINTLASKYVLFTPLTVDDISIFGANGYASNGVLHKISGAILPKQNIYQFLLAAPNLSKQREAIKARDKKVFDPSRAEVLGINPNTGKPIYKEGTDSAIVNSYLQTYPINREDRLFTYVVLTDQAFGNELSKLQNYFTTVTNNADSSLFGTQQAILKDLTFRGLKTPAMFSDSVFSIDSDSIKVKIDPSAIVETHRVSNGIVYVVNKIEYNTSAKLGVRVIQGESWDESAPLRSSESRGSTMITRLDPNDMQYTMLRYLSPPAINHWFQYKRELKKVTYRVYWRVPRDFALNPTSTGTLNVVMQKIAFGKFNTTVAGKDLGYKEVGAREVINGTNKVFLPKYEEIYIGDYTSDKFGVENIFLVGNNGTVTGLNNLALDYIRMVPVAN